MAENVILFTQLSASFSKLGLAPEATHALIVMTEQSQPRRKDVLLQLLQNRKRKLMGIQLVHVAHCRR